MSFMAVAYVPAYLEDRSIFIKERANGLYGATSFVVANFLIGLPYLCKPWPPSFAPPTFNFVCYHSHHHHPADSDR